ncbi:hypothetical protein TERMP_01430 [Thermococcus barophilus MP]|uniref:NurA domain-containing protein n=2 Tax=Thermococcus barophilus TaxID=55802 RepID=F0LI05_THEBM|nr:hypothetical protein TERMP_01430 [Thermococcus barophilus MP]
MIKQYRCDVFSKVDSYLKKLQSLKRDIRYYLDEEGLLRSSGEILEYRGIDPTVCGVDGAYAISKQIALDVVGIAAVAVEGLPPYEKRLWEKPHHIAKIFPVEHKSKTSTLATGLMFSYELELATKAPHNVVFIDGSLTTHLIKTGMSFSILDSEDIPSTLRDIYIERAEDTLKNYLKVVTSPKSDQVFAGVPKYSSRNEICMHLIENYPELLKVIPLNTYNDKALLSLILKPEEIVGPIRLQKYKEEGKWHLSGKTQMAKFIGPHYEDYVSRIISALEDLYVIYYKPSSSQPALRVEIPKNVAKNKARLSLVIKALQDQSKFPGIIEPYPLYLADLFVKHLGGALSEIKDIVLSDLAVLDLEMNPVDVLLAMHEYRSVGGYE